MSIAGGGTAPTKTPRWLMVLAAVMVAGISLLAFVVSFEVLSDVAIRAGLPAGIAWAWPVIVDGSIVTAMLVIFAWRGRPRRATVWPWVTLSFFAAVSVVGNGVHTAVVYDAKHGITMWFAIFVGAVPPIGLLLSSEMLVRLLTPADAVVAAVATVVSGPDTSVTKPAAPAAISEEEPSENTEIQGTVEPFATVAPLLPERDTEATETVVDLVEALSDDSDMTASLGPVTAVVTPIATVDANHNSFMTPVATVTQLHAVEAIPGDPAGQVGWIVARAQAGHDVTRGTLSQLFEEAGQSMADRTLQRRLADARKQAPELLQANA